VINKGGDLNLANVNWFAVLYIFEWRPIRLFLINAS